MNPKLSKINVIDMDANLNSEMTTNEWLLYLRNIVIKQNERINNAATIENCKLNQISKKEVF